MNQPKQTISKTETVEEAEQAAESYFQKYKYIGVTAIKPAFIDGANWKEQHSYSEQEVRAICEDLRKRYYDIAESYEMKPFEKHKCIDKKSFLIVDFDNLLKK